jgi:3-oxoacyl-(acyl-carrier-protein) synthase
VTPVAATVVGAAAIARDDARDVPWADVRHDKLASVTARGLVCAAEAAWPAAARAGAGCIGVYVATGETGLDVHAFLDAAHVAWDEHPDDPDYGRMGGRALRAIDPYYSLRTLANGPAALLAMHLAATGPSLTVAQQRIGVAWVLLAALDDLRVGRCEVAVVGACDVPSIPTRRVIARRRGELVATDAAAVIVLRQDDGESGLAPGLARGARAAGAGTWSVRWDAVVGGRSEPRRPCDGSVVDAMQALVECGAARGWAGPFEVEIADDAGRAVIAVGV